MRSLAYNTSVMLGAAPFKSASFSSSQRSPVPVRLHRARRVGLRTTHPARVAHRRPQRKLQAWPGPYIIYPDPFTAYPGAPTRHTQARSQNTRAPSRHTGGHITTYPDPFKAYPTTYPGPYTTFPGTLSQEPFPPLVKVR